MATAERDLYEVLGVERGASDADIKKAFRRLARELHPDVSQATDAQERFREVATAYEVLSNAEIRRLYDRYGHAGLKRGGYTPSDFDLGSLGDIFSAFFGDDLFGRASRGAARGADLAVSLGIDLADAYTGVTRRVDIEVAAPCERCGGDGAEPDTGTVACPTCGGHGRLQQVSRSVFGEFVRTQSCPACGGQGRVVETPCEACAGAGRTLREKALDVEIPPGIHDGQQIRLRGEGHAGAAGGPPGDVYVEVRVAPDERFARDGSDVVTTVDLTVVQASLGARVSVPTLEGEVELEFPPGTQPGTVRVVRGAGMPVLQGFGRGDQRVLVNVLVPRHLTEDQRRLLQEFESAAGDANYRADEGFFE